MRARMEEMVVANAHEPASAPRGRRVLVVDDNVDAAQTLATILELDGYDVRVAYNGGEGLRIAAQWPLDAGVLDIGIPDINGYELCRRLRAGAERPLLLIACTGWGQHEDMQRAREAGFDHHLIKPIDPEAVLRLLRAL